MSFYDDIHAQPAALRAVVEDWFSNVERKAQLGRAVELLREAKEVRVTSMGSAYFSCVPLARLLSEQRSGVELCYTTDVLEEERKEGRVTVIFSRSGESGEVAEYVKTKGVEKVIAVSMTPESTLAKESDCFLYDVSPFDGLICTQAFSSLWLCGCLMAYAYGGVFEKQQDRLYSFIDELDGWRKEVDKELEGSDFLDGLVMPYCLSHGMGLSIAQLGSLLFQEGTRVYAAADHMGMFHHGPVEIAGGDLKVFWLDLDVQKRTRVYWDKLKAQGTKLFPIHGGEEFFEGGVKVPGDGYPMEWRYLAAAMVFQLATHYGANRLGHTAGEMENLQWLVT